MKRKANINSHLSNDLMLKRGMRSIALREGDAIIIEPWEFDDDKGDVLFKYTDNQVRKLKEMGKLTTESSEF